MPTSTENETQLHHEEHPKKLHPPFAQPDPGRRATPHMAVKTSGDPSSALAGSFELSPETHGLDSDASSSMPSIDRFVDDLPLIDEFVFQSTAPARTAVTAQGATTNDTAADEGWADADWQSYDWSGLASLGASAPEVAEANAAWSTTDWDTTQTSPPDQSAYVREHEVAAALEEIARKIRSGELSLHKFRGTPPEAAMAAAFASLLRSRG